MRILVIGANGFIGSAIVTAAITAGFGIRGVVRDAARLQLRFPGIDPVEIDLQTHAGRDPIRWDAALDGVDAVVNAAGVLQPRKNSAAWAVHMAAPDALYAACERNGVRRVIHISAVGVDQAVTEFARSKLAGDEALMKRDLDWTVLRPAVVVGEGSYGGTSMLRAIAAFPWVTPVIGDGTTEMDFIHNTDLAEAVVRLIQSGDGMRTVQEPASPERLTQADAVHAYRRWLGLRTGPVIGVPLWLAKAICRIGDIARLDPMVTTTITQFETRLTGDSAGFEAVTGVAARGLSATLAGQPAGSQDLWHARLYLARPVVRLALILMWLVSGLLGLFGNPAVFADLLAPFTQDEAIATGLVVGMSLVDLAIAAALSIGWRLKTMANVQLLVVLGYTVAITLVSPNLWGDPIGGVLKNIPVLALLLVHRVLEQER